MMCVKRVGRAGFTLIEIMIVIAIIAILAGIVVPNIAQARYEAGVVACQQNCKAGLEAVQMVLLRKSWKQAGEIVPGWSYIKMPTGSGTEWLSGSLDGLVEAGYLSQLLRCKTSGGEYRLEAGRGDGRYEVIAEIFRDRSWGDDSVNVSGSYTIVTCGGGHKDLFSWGADWPAYEESAGAGFYW